MYFRRNFFVTWMPVKVNVALRRCRSTGRTGWSDETGGSVAGYLGWTGSGSACGDRKAGVVYTDQEGDLVTSIVNNKDCVFTCYDEKGCCYCAIEKAFREGKTDFYKPISCHLYPIRIGDYGSYKAVNYHRWDVCKAAVLLGKRECPCL